jgi:hypothetical protein
VAEPTQAVTNALVRLVKGEIAYDDLTEDEIYALIQVARNHRNIQRDAATELHRRNVSFKDMADKLGVHESTTWRWANDDGNAQDFF